MQHALHHPAAFAYAITVLVLCLNLLVLWTYSGVTRGKGKTAMNEEDAAWLQMELTPADPPAVARVLRAHSNAQSAIVPFLFMGWILVMMGGTAQVACVIFGVFAVARILHSVTYLAEMQPWRTVFFVVGLLATLALMGDVVWLLLQASAPMPLDAPAP